MGADAEREPGGALPLFRLQRGEPFPEGERILRRRNRVMNRVDALKRRPFQRQGFLLSGGQRQARTAGIDLSARAVPHRKGEGDLRRSRRMVDRFEFRNGFSAQIEHGEVAAGFQLCHHAPFEEIEGVERDCPRFSAEFQPHDPERLFRYTGFPLLFFYTRTGCGGVDDGGISFFGLFQGEPEGAPLPVMDDGGNGERFFCGGEVQDHFAAAERRQKNSIGGEANRSFPRGIELDFSIADLRNRFQRVGKVDQ